jgi:hypothetical protein
VYLVHGLQGRSLASVHLESLCLWSWLARCPKETSQPPAGDAGASRITERTLPLRFIGFCMFLYCWHLYSHSEPKLFWNWHTTLETLNYTTFWNFPSTLWVCVGCLLCNLVSQHNSKPHTPLLITLRFRTPELPCLVSPLCLHFTQAFELVLRAPGVWWKWVRSQYQAIGDDCPNSDSTDSLSGLRRLSQSFLPNISRHQTFSGFTPKSFWKITCGLFENWVSRISANIPVHYNIIYMYIYIYIYVLYIYLYIYTTRIYIYMYIYMIL